MGDEEDLDAFFARSADDPTVIAFVGKERLERAAKRAREREENGGVTPLKDADFNRFRMQAENMMQNADWQNAKPAHFVAAFAILHEKVYGVAPADLGPKDRALASIAAARMLHKHFADRPHEMADFLRWTWGREHGREKWRRQNDKPGARIGAYAQFHRGTLVTEYLVDVQRAANRR